MSRYPLKPLAIAATTALAAGLSPVAYAGSVLERAVVSSNADPTSSGDAITDTLDLLNSLGSAEVPVSSRPGSSVGGHRIDHSITEAAIVDKQVESDRVERWTVASPAMKRTVEVQIW
ncbi:MAG TPA: hypothetical protein K8V93_03950, partial [Corynebacterium pollutisoli]|nr:hypothetical protein [Corynebacterium pollutisoli]